MRNSGRMGKLALHAVRAMVAVVCLSVILAGFTVPWPAGGSDAAQVAPIHAIASMMDKDCDHLSHKSSPDHRSHGSCGTCLNCPALVQSPFSVAMVARLLSAFDVAAVQQPDSHVIIPPSPPPKSAVRA